MRAGLTAEIAALLAPYVVPAIRQTPALLCARPRHISPRRWRRGLRAVRMYGARWRCSPLEAALHREAIRG